MTLPGAFNTATRSSWSSLRYRLAATKLASRWARVFEKNGVPEPRESAKHIINFVTKRRDEANTTPSRDLSHNQVEEINRLCQQRLQRVPVQYIIGEWDFRYTSLILRPPVFIPEPETEELVGLMIEHSVRKVEFEENSSQVFLDAGCGSGAIGIALLTESPQLIGHAIDVSTTAVDLTKENAQRNKVTHRLAVSQCSIQQGVDVLPSNHFQWIISNPPYIPTATIDTLQQEVTDYIDHRALDGGQDGMATTRQLITASQTLLKPGGELWIETDLGQDIASLCEGTLLSYTATYPDYTGRNRFHHLKKDKKHDSQEKLHHIAKL